MTNHPLKNKNIILGVTGSIASYKSIDLASKLTQLGAKVDTILTDSAQQFINPISFKSITHRQVVTNLFDTNSELSVNHVAMAEAADCIIVAPATANTIAKISHGISNDALGTTILATEAPVIIAPAMDGKMFENPATQENLAILIQRGFFVCGPEFGRMASGLIGLGRLSATQDIIQVASMILGQNSDYSQKKIVITAGGTQEDLDPVRTITNRSSGKMGFAIAEAARDRGANVTLISAPTSLNNPIGINVENIKTALEMQKSLETHSLDCDVLIMAAAVGDWRAKSISETKAKKSDHTNWEIELIKNPDILSSISNESLIKVGFAAETENLIENAQKKIINKNLNLIIGNDVSRNDIGFNSEDNEVIIINKSGEVENLPKMTKYELAHEILDRVQALLK